MFNKGRGYIDQVGGQCINPVPYFKLSCVYVCWYVYLMSQAHENHLYITHAHAYTYVDKIHICVMNR